MKTMSKLLIFSVFLAFIFASCTKKENRIYFEGGTAPVLTASSTNALVLLETNKTKPAITLSWTNPAYSYNTGIGSQDVNYILEVDKAGSNFGSASKQEVSFVSDMSKTFTVQELNGILTRMDLADGVSHPLEFRIKSALGGAVPLLSNVLKLNINPYLDVAVPIPPTGELYITGDATPSGWTNSPPVSQKFTTISKTEFTITIALKGGLYYKFLSTPGFWQPQYGGDNADGGSLGFNMGLPGQSDPPAIPSKEGTYKITVNFKTGRYSVVKQ